VLVFADASKVEMQNSSASESPPPLRGRVRVGGDAAAQCRQRGARIKPAQGRF
jgi:hypothetical protein